MRDPRDVRPNKKCAHCGHYWPYPSPDIDYLAGTGWLCTDPDTCITRQQEARRGL